MNGKLVDTDADLNRSASAKLGWLNSMIASLQAYLEYKVA